MNFSIRMCSAGCLALVATCLVANGASADLSAWLKQPAEQRKADDPALRRALTKSEVDEVKGLLGRDRIEVLKPQRKDELEQKSIVLEGKTLRWLEKTFGEAPAGGRSLWISMHGGGSAAP